MSDFTRYIPYPIAMGLLDKRLKKVTPEELAAWIFLGPKLGGIAAYSNANELNPPPRFEFNYFSGSDYLASLMAVWFLQEDIINFQPSDRYITGQALLDRWNKFPYIKPRDFIIAKIHESRLIGIHPIAGYVDEENGPPIENGLFGLSMVNAIEVEDFEVELTSSQKINNSSPEMGTPEWRSQIARDAAIARHSKPNGSYEKRRKIQEIWTTGKYTSRDLCAEQECAALNMSFSAARRALKNIPKPE